jgi:hypothetical protein
VTNNKGRTTCLTNSFVTIPATAADEGSFVPLAPTLVPSKANRLNQTLDAASKSLVRFIEASQKLRILEIDVDYIVDADSQLWL